MLRKKIERGKVGLLREQHDSKLLHWSGILGRKSTHLHKELFILPIILVWHPRRAYLPRVAIGPVIDPAQQERSYST